MYLGKTPKSTDRSKKRRTRLLWSARSSHPVCDDMLSCTPDLRSYHMNHLQEGRGKKREEHQDQELLCVRRSQPIIEERASETTKQKKIDLHFSNWGSRKPMTNWSTSTMNLSPALALPPIGSRSLRCSIIDRTKSSSSSCAVRANACTVGGSIVEYGRNDDDEVEDAIERGHEMSFV